jgi:16S rRNA (adenine1518-N6/adenine1519-N6)-dimethyltransferase
MQVRAKKHLGQHFLEDGIAQNASLKASPAMADYTHVVEVGPGTGALTKHLLHRPDTHLHSRATKWT